MHAYLIPYVNLSEILQIRHTLLYHNCHMYKAKTGALYVYIVLLDPSVQTKVVKETTARTDNSGTLIILNIFSSNVMCEERNWAGIQNLLMHACMQH